MTKPTISVICAVYNRERVLADALDSIFQQSYPAIQAIVIDGLSSDRTPVVVDRYRDRIGVAVREKDEGIYDALNKGIRHASGEVIGFLHADDMLADAEVLADVGRIFENPEVDAVYGELLYVAEDDQDRIVRYWQESPYRVERFRRGWMPPHPTVYLRRKVYEQFGDFRTDLGTAADYELMVRLMVKHQIRVKFLPRVMVKMRVGGKSNASLANRRKANLADANAWRVNDLTPPPLLRLSKPLRKLPQYWRRPRPTSPT